MLDTIESAPGALLEAFGLALGAMGFDAAAFERVGEEARARDLALVVVYFAGVSQGVGHGVVLFLNRVRPMRFALSLALTGAIYLTSALVTAASALLVADVVFHQGLAFAPTIAVIALAHAPRLLGVLSLAPYIGEQLDRLLDVWVFLLVLFGLHHGVGVSAHAAAWLALIGWASARVLRLVFGRPLTAVVSAARRAAAGEPLTLNAQNLVDSLQEQAREIARRWGDRRE